MTWRSEEVEVDALALMLDGAIVDGARLGRASLEVLEARQMHLTTLMERKLRDPEWAEVAEAIMQLEALADWRPTEADALGGGFAINALAEKAFADTVERLVRSKLWGPVELAEQTIDMTLLEAAARLRDGWRPGKRSKR